MKKTILLWMLLFVQGFSSAQAILIKSQSATYAQNFDSLSTSGTGLTKLPAGCWFTETGTSANATYRAGTGSSTAGDTNSFGSALSLDRSLGALASGSLSSNFGLMLVNQSSSSITQFTFSVIMEQWRSGNGRTTPDSLYFYYGVNTSGSPASSWIRHPAADLASLTLGLGQELDGNDPLNRQSGLFLVTGVSIAVNDTLFLRWEDPDMSGSDDGLAIDDFQFTAGGSLPVTWGQWHLACREDGNSIFWQTWSEINNSHFEVQRGRSIRDFETIGRVEGAGNSNIQRFYTFTDRSPEGDQYYRIRQTDFDGTYTYSPVLFASTKTEDKWTVTGLQSPFGATFQMNIKAGDDVTGYLELVTITGQICFESRIQLRRGSNPVLIDTSLWPPGVYFIRMKGNGTSFMRKIMKDR